jgi:hypothetical protein
LLRSKGYSSRCFDRVFRESEQIKAAANTEIKQENYRRELHGTTKPTRLADKQMLEQYKAQNTKKIFESKKQNLPHKDEQRAPFQSSRRRRQNSKALQIEEYLEHTSSTRPVNRIKPVRSRVASTA